MLFFAEEARPCLGIALEFRNGFTELRSTRLNCWIDNWNIMQCDAIMSNVPDYGALILECFVRHMMYMLQTVQRLN